MNNLKHNNIQWEEFACYPQKLIEIIQGLFKSTDPFELTIQWLKNKTGVDATIIEKVLEILVKKGFFQIKHAFRCPICGKDLEDKDINAPECIHCHTDFGAQNCHPESYLIYFRDGERSRDVKWILSLHGMNTSGRWQQEFSWFLQNLYGYSIPVAIYKYGNIKLSPLLAFRHRTYLKRLVRNIHRFQNKFEQEQQKKPDVIAHSFGTLLLAKVLMENEDIKVGRVILTGSIIPPDFAWRPLIERGQVEGVLCHHSRKDFPVKIAHWFIPGSGPSGVYGFNNKKNVIHIEEKQFSHSDYFEDEHLANQVIKKWTPFLTLPESALKKMVQHNPSEKSWKPSRLRFLTQFVLSILILSLLLLALGAIPASVMGYKEIIRQIFFK